MRQPTRYKKLKTNRADPFTRVQLSIPTYLYNQLKTLCLSSQTPLTNILNRILYQHFKNDEIELEIPDTLYNILDCDADSDDDTILKLIAGVKSGVDLDLLVALGDTIGVPSQERILNSVKRLVDKEMLEPSREEGLSTLRLKVPVSVRVTIKDRGMFRAFKNETNFKRSIKTAIPEVKEVKGV